MGLEAITMSYYDDFVDDGLACHECGQLLDRPSKALALCQDCSGDTTKRKPKKPSTAQKPSKQWPPRKRNHRD